MNTTQVPEIPKVIVEYLERIFPDKLGNDVQESQERVVYRKGQVSVVQHLRSQFDRQNP